MSQSLLIEGAWIVTLDDDIGVIEDGAVLLERGRVHSIGPTNRIAPGYAGPRFDARGRTVMPGLVNAHMHLYSTFARGMAVPGEPPDRFSSILEQLWWKLDKALELDDCYPSAVPPLCEGLRHGVTTIIDHHASPRAIEGSLDRIAEACRDVRVRANLSYEVSDRDGAERTTAGIEENRRWLTLVGEAKDPMLGGLLGLHAAFTLSDITLARCVEAARELRAGFHIHVAESEDDPTDAVERSGTRTIHRLKAAKILGPRTLAAHCIHIDDTEIQALKQSRTAVVTNPQSNMSNAVGAPRLLELLAHGLDVGLGSDGMTGDVFQEARALSLLHRHIAGDPRVGWMESARVAFNGTRAVAHRFFDAPVGVLKPGAFGDVVVRDYQPPTPLTSDNVWGHFLFGLGASPVTDVWVGGRRAVEDGRVIGVNEASAAADARRRAQALWGRMS
jgi:putative selenium metabolism protein SsnA